MLRLATQINPQSAASHGPEQHPSPPFKRAFYGPTHHAQAFAPPPAPTPPLVALLLTTLMLSVQAQTPPSSTEPTAPTALQGGKPRIERAADLPRFTYRINGPPEALVRSPKKFASFAAEMRRNVDSVLAGYDIPDRATQRDLITQLAILDFLESRHEPTLQRAEQVRDVQNGSGGTRIVVCLRAFNQRWVRRVAGDRCTGLLIATS